MTERLFWCLFIGEGPLAPTGCGLLSEERVTMETAVLTDPAGRGSSVVVTVHFARLNVHEIQDDIDTHVET
jgi:hypothetical protein